MQDSSTKKRVLTVGEAMDVSLDYLLGKKLNNPTQTTAEPMEPKKPKTA